MGWLGLVWWVVETSHSCLTQGPLLSLPLSRVVQQRESSGNMLRDVTFELTLVMQAVCVFVSLEKFQVCFNY